MNYKIPLSIAIFVAVAFVAVSTSHVALAYKATGLTGPNYTPERHIAMEKAFESGDYEAWKSLIQGRGRVSQLVTKENFAEFAKVHELTEQGKIAEADAIREKLGLSKAVDANIGFGQGRGGCRFAR